MIVNIAWTDEIPCDGFFSLPGCLKYFQLQIQAFDRKLLK